jgi:hypothetical protein
MSRKNISTRMRFEVFKRDGFQCQYCGAHPPQVILHCDHIHPVSEGGENVIENLVTACQGCNLGKSNILLEEKPVSLADRAAEMAEREAQIAGYETIMRDRRSRLEDDAQTVLNAICDAYNRDGIPRADFTSIKRFVEQLGLDATLDAVDVATAKFNRGYSNGFRYFCGVCWNTIRRRDANGKN